MKTVNEEIIKFIIAAMPKTKAAFDDARRIAANKLKVKQPSNRALIVCYQNYCKKTRVKPDETLLQLIRKSEVRSLSGIAVVTSLVKPYMCPGQCVYCPTEVRMPKSYIATEPAAARALALNFDPYELMRQRLITLKENGHPTDKIEYIVKGGTWNAYTLGYQYWYILESFRACNELKKNPSKKQIEAKQKTHEKKLTEYSPLTELQEALAIEQKKNETSSHRIIGLTLETRPDAISPKTIWHMRQQGCTRIELGLQATDDKILALIKRGHTVQQFRDAMFLLRQAGFKVDLHFMPDLPGTTPDHDVEMYREIFSDPGLKPDMIKIYPNTVIKSAELYQWFLDGRYVPYGDTPKMTEALMHMKLATPRYCRISRLIRDIPATEIEGGNTVTNLRELLEKKLHEQGKKCVCLRCREISRQIKHIPKDTVPQLFVDEYDTIGGQEYFISLEDPKRIALFGFLRLRIPDTTADTQKIVKLIPEIKNCAFIRELHVYGQLVEIGKQNISASQHTGLGKKLVAAAEKIAREQAFDKVAVISGVGVRDYYRHLGYRRGATYMIKKLDKTKQKN
jgi:elongator complex protein 3